MTVIREHRHFSINICSWTESKDELRHIREAVFIEEQGVPVKLEWDEYDPDATHVLVRDSKQHAIATARLLADGHIGRMAVLKSWRHQGIGSAMLHTLIAVCQDKQLTPFLDAQIHALEFYEKNGFVSVGDEFMDAGIPHKRMLLELSS